MLMKYLLKYILGKCGIEIIRFAPRAPERLVISLEPKGASKGTVLLSQSIAPFLTEISKIVENSRSPYWRFLSKNSNPLNSHTGFWQCSQMATTFLDLGYGVDVIEPTNRHFIPQKKYSFFTGYGNFERLSKLCGDDCVKILHMVWNHWSFHNSAQYNRLLALKSRKHVVLKPRRLLEPNLAIEYADYGTITGNEFSIKTYSYANKPIFRTPVSAIAVYDWPKEKNFDACRNHFLWFGGPGLVHKGLDLVLDTFRELPDCHLTVCGPIDAEEDFKRLYYKELFETANIHTVGWVDVTSPEFLEIANSCIGLIFASCSECGGGSAIACMHAGLIPIANRESSLETGDFGIALENCHLDTIKETVQMVCSLSKDELKLRAHKAWEYARANHTRERFAEDYRQTIERIIALEAS